MSACKVILTTMSHHVHANNFQRYLESWIFIGLAKQTYSLPSTHTHHHYKKLGTHSWCQIICIMGQKMLIGCSLAFCLVSARVGNACRNHGRMPQWNMLISWLACTEFLESMPNGNTQQSQVWTKGFQPLWQGLKVAQHFAKVLSTDGFLIEPEAKGQQCHQFSAPPGCRREISTCTVKIAPRPPTLFCHNYLFRLSKVELRITKVFSQGIFSL